jgi:hypothetical protein
MAIDKFSIELLLINIDVSSGEKYNNREVLLLSFAQLVSKVMNTNNKK